MPVIEYLPVAAAGGANVDTQAEFAGSGYQIDGFTTGKAKSSAANKVWRQSSVMTTALAHLISDNLGGIDVLDDGDVTALESLLLQAISAIANETNLAPVVVAFAAAMHFNAASGRNFEATLTGNNASATLDGLVAGQRLILMLKQDGVGGRVFTPPAALPLPPIDPAPNAVTIFEIYIDSALTPRILSGPNVS